MFSNDALYFAYYPFVIVAFIYMLFTVGFNRLGLFIVLLFWEGMVGFLSIVASNFGFPFELHNIYKIIMTLWGVYLFGREIFHPRNWLDICVIFGWLIFSIGFWVSYIENGGGFFTILSQFFYGYGLKILLYFAVKSILIDGNVEYLKNLLLKILFVQVILSVVKIIVSLIVIHEIPEYIVGSVSYSGAGAAVVLPIGALILYWIVNEKKLNRKHILISITFLIIAMASMKRSPVIMFPIVWILLSVVRSQHIRPGLILKYIPVAFLLFYLGLRLNKSLNPESIVWGSYDPAFAYRYSLNYIFGANEAQDLLDPSFEGTGKGFSAFLVFQPSRLGFSNTKEALIGNGLYDIAIKAYGRIIGSYGSEVSTGYDIEHIGSNSGSTVQLYGLGYIGFISIMLINIAMISNARDIKLRLLLMAYYLWELFLYENNFMGQRVSIVIVVFICMYDRYYYSKSSGDNCRSVSVP